MADCKWRSTKRNALGEAVVSDGESGSDDVGAIVVKTLSVKVSDGESRSDDVGAIVVKHSVKLW